MSKEKQRQEVKNRLQSQLSAAAVFATQPGIETAAPSINNGVKEEDKNAVHQEHHTDISTDNQSAITEERQHAVTDEHRKEITEDNHTGITEEENNGRRGPKKKGTFKKVTLNLDVETNAKLDEYILTLKQQAIREGKEAPNKSEWVRDLVKEKLRELGVL